MATDVAVPMPLTGGRLPPQKPSMKLRDYLKASGLTMAAFAREAGLSKPAVWRACCEEGRIPAPETMERVKEASGGLVTANDWHGHEPTYGAGGEVTRR